MTNTLKATTRRAVGAFLLGSALAFALAPIAAATKVDPVVGANVDAYRKCAEGVANGSGMTYARCCEHFGGEWTVSKDGKTGVCDWGPARETVVLGGPAVQGDPPPMSPDKLNPAPAPGAPVTPPPVIG